MDSKKNISKKMLITLISLAVVVVGCFSVLIVILIKQDTPPKPQYFSIGEKATIQNWELKVNDYYINPYNDDYKIEIELWVKNNGTKTQQVLGYDSKLSFQLIYKNQGNEYIYYTNFGFDNNLYGDISPLSEKTDVLTYYVPSAVLSNGKLKLKITENKKEPSTILIYELNS